MTPDPKYPAYIGFNVTKEMKDDLEDYAKSLGVEPSKILRWALIEYLKEKGVLEKDKSYLP